jgi:hypothetical protein
VTGLVDELVERSGDLKRQVVAFSEQARFDRVIRHAVRDRFGRGAEVDEAEWNNFVDWLIMEYRLRDGRTFTEAFAASRPDLPPHERDFLAGWRRVREGVFEVTGRDRGALLAGNLVDELPYRIRANVGPDIFERMPTGSYVVTRLVPVGGDWLISGVPAVLPAREERNAVQVAARITVDRPDLVFQNPDKVAAGWRMQRTQREAFIAHFGSDEITVSADDVDKAMAGFWLSLGGDPAAMPPSDCSWLPPSAESVGVIYDETGGLGMYADYALACAAFADPDLLRRRRYKETVLAYFKDESVDPVPLRRLAARHPGTADIVLRRALGKPHLRWDPDGEAQLRVDKATWYEREHLPHVTVMGERLAAAIRSAAE